MDEHTKGLVAEIIKRLAQRLGADGRKGDIVVVFSGATVGMADAIVQVRGLICDGYQVQTVFSDAAEKLFGSWIEDQLLGFPFIRKVDPADWLSACSGAGAVVVPLLSLNTAAKVSHLIADTLPANMMLKALANGKPVFAARNGTQPEAQHWAGKSGAAPAFRQAVAECLKALEGLGCRLTDVKDLRSAVRHALCGQPATRMAAVSATASFSEGTAHREYQSVSQRVITAAHIRHASSRGIGLRLLRGAVVTPLAKELAFSAGVKLIHSQ